MMTDEELQELAGGKVPLDAQLRALEIEALRGIRRELMENRTVLHELSNQLCQIRLDLQQAQMNRH